MKPITIGQWKIVPRPEAWQFLHQHPIACLWIATASLIATAIMIKFTIHTTQPARPHKITKPRRHEPLQHLTINVTITTEGQQTQTKTIHTRLNTTQAEQALQLLMSNPTDHERNN